jgi:hypothetical protein
MSAGISAAGTVLLLTYAETMSAVSSIKLPAVEFSIMAPSPVFGVGLAGPSAPGDPCNQNLAARIRTVLCNPNTRIVALAMNLIVFLGLKKARQK